MKVGDIVKWTEVEEVYNKFCSHPSVEDLTNVRKCGIVIEQTPYMFFVFWQNGDLMAQKPNTIEVIK